MILLSTWLESTKRSSKTSNILYPLRMTLSTVLNIEYQKHGEMIKNWNIFGNSLQILNWINKIKDKMNAFETNDFELLMILCTNKSIHNL